MWSDNILKTLPNFWVIVFLAISLLFIWEELVAFFKGEYDYFPYFNPHPTKDFAVLILILVLIYVLLCKRYSIPKNKYWKLFYITTTLLYVVYRFYRKDDLLEFNKLPFFRVLDIILIFIVFLFLYNKKSEVINEGLSDGAPVEVDNLNYSQHAKNIVQWILKTQSNQSFAIGLNASWGYGKTSFFNFMKAELKDKENFEDLKFDAKNLIVMDFKPWFAKDEQTLVDDFFQDLSNNIPDIKFKLKLNSYTHHLLGHNGSWKNFIEFIKHFFMPPTSIAKLFEDISNVLIASNKKVVIFIDDIDRLENKEIFQVLKLIRNTANFPNLFFVVAYDKSYVSSALDKMNIDNSELYLQKIFQLEITLPTINNKKLITDFLNQLKEILSLKNQEELESFNRGNSNFDCLSDWIKNKRDVVCLINSFKINYMQIKDDVSVLDFLHIEILRLNYYQIYLLIGYNKELFIEPKKYNESLEKYQLKNFKPNNIKHADDELNFRPLFMDVLNTNLQRNKISEIESNKIYKLLNVLFGLISTNKTYTEDSIIWPNRFYRYFQFQLEENSISNEEFEIAFEKELISFQNQIKKWIYEFDNPNSINFKKVKELENKLLRFKVEDRESFQNKISSLFYLASYPLGNNKFIDIAEIKIAEVLSLEYIVKKFYKNQEGLYEDFIFSLFDNADFPFLYHSRFLFWNVENDFSNYLPIKENKIYSLTKKYLFDYKKRIKKLDKSLFDLFMNCRQRFEYLGNDKFIEENVRNPTLNEVYFFPTNEVKDFMRNFILNEHFIDYCYNYSLSEVEEGQYFISNNLYCIFDSIPNFIKILNSFRNKNINHKTEDSNLYDDFLNEQLEELIDFYAIVNDSITIKRIPLQYSFRYKK